MEYIKSIKRSLNLGFPYIAVETPDYPDTTKSLIKSIKDRGIVQWDMLRGAIGLNELGAEASSTLNKGEPPEETTVRLEECLRLALDNLPPKSVILIQDIHLFLETKSETERALIIQAVRNLRDAFKSSERSLLFLVPSIKLPNELANDVEVISAPLPTVEEINEIAVSLFKAAQLPAPDEDTIQRVADAMLGVTAFAAENAIAKNLRKEGVDFEGLWETKKRYIRSISGLSMPDSVSSFDQLGGLAYLKHHGKKIINSKRKPKLVVLVDEVEKQMSGLGDSNGINQDCFGQILQAMNDNDWEGVLLTGFAGVGKTEWAKALGHEAGGLFLSLDLGAVKGGIVGDSERMIRTALATLKAMGGENVLFVSTCNSMDDLRPEFISRQEDVIFCDLYEREQRDAIFRIHMKKFGIPDQELPVADGWAGREIRNCVKKAWKYNSTLLEEAQYIVPNTSKKDELRKKAVEGKWLSAETGRPYSASKSLSMESVRKIAKS
jgi:hypothetical protein